MICDACGKPMTQHERNQVSEPRLFEGQTIVVVNGISGQQSYMLDFHHECIERLMKAIGRERMAIQAENTPA